MVQYGQQLTVFLFRTWYTVNKKKWGLNMLKSWTPGEEPDKDEMKVQLEKTRNRLYDLQMKIKEHKLPVLVLFEGWLIRTLYNVHYALFMQGNYCLYQRFYYFIVLLDFFLPCYSNLTNISCQLF